MMAQSWQKVADRRRYAEEQLALPENHPSMTPGRRANLRAIAAHASNRLSEAGRCFECGKELTLPESKARGYGAACAEKIATRRELTEVAA